MSSDLSGEASAKSEVLAKEDWSFGGLRCTIDAAGSCPWGFTLLRVSMLCCAISCSSSAGTTRILTLASPACISMIPHDLDFQRIRGRKLLDFGPIGDVSAPKGRFLVFQLMS